MKPDSRAQRVLLVLLGGWICLIVCMVHVATTNFRVVEPAALRNAEQVYAGIPEGAPRRQALRYVASELNRSLFASYDQAQIVVGVVALAMLVLSCGRRLPQVLLLGLCLLFTAFSWGWITPRNSTAHTTSSSTRRTALRPGRTPPAPRRAAATSCTGSR